MRFQRVPVSFGRAQWLALGKLYLALETSGDLAKVDQLVFQAIHEKKTQLPDEKAILDWAGSRARVGLRTQGRVDWRTRLDLTDPAALAAAGVELALWAPDGSALTSPLVCGVVARSCVRLSSTSPER